MNHNMIGTAIPVDLTDWARVAAMTDADQSGVAGLYEDADQNGR
ncbi:MAG: hypothetical protein VXW65_08565 [Pseudomonadota bacterium]|nr:hypothetical protein [Pseudomonadota bacterium]